MSKLQRTSSTSGSPSSRRAWIEIRRQASAVPWPVVALLAEGVDRNFPEGEKAPLTLGRPPRGGRG